MHNIFLRLLRQWDKYVHFNIEARNSLDILTLGPHSTRPEEQLLKHRAKPASSSLMGGACEGLQLAPPFCTVPAPHSTPELPTQNHSVALNSSLGLCPPGGGHGPQGSGLTQGSCLWCGQCLGLWDTFVEVPLSKSERRAYFIQSLVSLLLTPRVRLLACGTLSALCLSPKASSWNLADLVLFTDNYNNLAQIQQASNVLLDN